MSVLILEQASSDYSLDTKYQLHITSYEKYGNIL